MSNIEINDDEQIRWLKSMQCRMCAVDVDAK